MQSHGVNCRVRAIPFKFAQVAEQAASQKINKFRLGTKHRRATLFQLQSQHSSKLSIFFVDCLVCKLDSCWEGSTFPTTAQSRIIKIERKKCPKLWCKMFGLKIWWCKIWTNIMSVVNIRFLPASRKVLTKSINFKLLGCGSGAFAVDLYCGSGMSVLQRFYSVCPVGGTAAPFISPFSGFISQIYGNREHFLLFQLHRGRTDAMLKLFYEIFHFHMKYISRLSDFQ